MDKFLENHNFLIWTKKLRESLNNPITIKDNTKIKNNPVRKTLGSQSFEDKFCQPIKREKICNCRVRKIGTLTNSILRLIHTKIMQSHCNHRYKNPYQNLTRLNLAI